MGHLVTPCRKDSWVNTWMCSAQCLALSKHSGEGFWSPTPSSPLWCACHAPLYLLNNTKGIPQSEKLPAELGESQTPLRPFPEITIYSSGKIYLGLSTVKNVFCSFNVCSRCSRQELVFHGRWKQCPRDRKIKSSPHPTPKPFLFSFLSAVPSLNFLMPNTNTLYYLGVLSNFQIPSHPITF